MSRGGTLPPLPRRKRNRLLNYDYSRKGAYLVTVCTRGLEHLLGTIVSGNGRQGAAPTKVMKLSPLGEIVQEEIQRFPHIYKGMYVDCYVIMPNHVHMVLVISNHDGRQGAAPTISQMVGGWKRVISMRAGFSPWQKSFHDHIIRNRDSYLYIVGKIESNVQKWEDDKYFS